MEAVNGVSDGGGPPPPSPLTGCYLLIVIGEPHSQEHKNIILQRIAKVSGLEPRPWWCYHCRIFVTTFTGHLQSLLYCCCRNYYTATAPSSAVAPAEEKALKMSHASGDEMSVAKAAPRTKSLLSWDLTDCLIDLEKELAIITEQAPEGEEARYGERLIQYASENLVTEVLIHPAVSTLAQCVRNLLSSFTRHRHIIHAGYTFAANGSWILQDGTFSYTDFAEAFHEIEVQRVIRAYENSISVDLHCSTEGDWTRLPKESFTKSCRVRVNPVDVLTSGSPSITNFLNYISPFLIPTDVESLLECSDVVGNIRFSHPTLYIFPGGQGDAALFGINGFNMLLDGGFSRKACFWDFVRHLDRLDAVLLTRLNNGNACGISAVLRRKMQNAVYPQIGHFFCNIQERKSILSPDGDKDKDPLLINLLDEGQEIITNLRKLNLTPQVCYKDAEPINLYHKVGHGTLDMYVLSPAKDSKEVRDFLQRWNSNDQKLFANQKSNNSKELQFPLQNLVSICALLIWQPANPNDNITRILYPGSTPQQKIFEGLDKLRNLEYIKYPVCSESKLVTSSSIMALKSKQLKDASLEKLIQPEPKKLDKLKEKPPKSGEIKNKIENKLADNIDKLEMTNGVSSENETDKTVKKSDSTDSDKSTKSTKPKKIDNKLEDRKPKHETKTKEAKSKPKIDSKPEKKKVLNEKKASPTTPKKTIEAKTNGEKEKPISKPIKYSPSTTPAKSAKEATNRKVIESKNRMITKKETKTSTEKKDTKPERKPISRRTKAPSPTTKTVGSPVKKIGDVHKPDIIKKAKLDKEGTTDSSTVSTPSADQKDLTKLTPEEIEQLKAQELADLKEEQEVVKEIEAVFRKGEIDKDSDTELRKVKDISLEDKSEPEEYLIIEKEEVEHDSLDEKDKEDETQKHARDSEESEKMRKLSDDIKVSLKGKDLGKYEEEDLKDKEDKEKPTDTPKEISVTSPEDKVDTSLEKKIVDIDTNEQNVALESQPDEKYSATVESGATTAPTLPEDERITLDEIKEDNGDQIIEEKHVKEDTKEKEVPVIQLPAKTFEAIPKLPPVVGIRLDKQSHIRDIVKTPDEVADLPVHEEADIEQYQMDVMKSSMKSEEIKTETKTHDKIEADIKETLDRDATVKDAKKEIDVEKVEVKAKEEPKPKESLEEKEKVLVDTSIQEAKITKTESKEVVETQEIKPKQPEIKETTKDLIIKKTADKLEESIKDTVTETETSTFIKTKDEELTESKADVEMAAHTVVESEEKEIAKLEIKGKDETVKEKDHEEIKEQVSGEKTDVLPDTEQPIVLEGDVKTQISDEHEDKLEELPATLLEKETIEVTEKEMKAELEIKTSGEKEMKEVKETEKEDKISPDKKEIILEKQLEKEEIEDAKASTDEVPKDDLKKLSEEKPEQVTKLEEESHSKVTLETAVEEIKKEDLESTTEPKKDETKTTLTKEDLSIEKISKVEQIEKIETKVTLLEEKLPEIPSDQIDLPSSKDEGKVDVVSETKQSERKEEKIDTKLQKDDEKGAEEKVVLEPKDKEQEIQPISKSEEEKIDSTLQKDDEKGAGEKITLEPKDKEQEIQPISKSEEQKVDTKLPKDDEKEVEEKIVLELKEKEQEIQPISKFEEQKIDTKLQKDDEKGVEEKIVLEPKDKEQEIQPTLKPEEEKIDAKLQKDDEKGVEEKIVLEPKDKEQEIQPTLKPEEEKIDSTLQRDDEKVPAEQIVLELKGKEQEIQPISKFEEQKIDTKLQKDDEKGVEEKIVLEPKDKEQEIQPTLKPEEEKIDSTLEKDDEKVPAEQVVLEPKEKEQEIQPISKSEEQKIDTKLQKDDEKGAEEKIVLESKDKEQEIQSILTSEEQKIIFDDKEEKTEQEESRKPIEDKFSVAIQDQHMLEIEDETSELVKDKEQVDSAEPSVKITESKTVSQEDLEKMEKEKPKEAIKTDEKKVIDTISEDKKQQSKLEKDMESTLDHEETKQVIDNEAKMKAIDEIEIQEAVDKHDVTFYIGDEKLERTKAEQKQEKIETKEEKKSKLDEKDIDDKQKQDIETEEAIEVRDVPYTTEDKSGEKKAEEHDKDEKLHAPALAEKETPVYSDIAAEKKKAEDELKESDKILITEKEQKDTPPSVSSQELVFDSNKYTNGVQEHVDAIKITDISQKAYAEDEKGTKEIAEQKVEKEEAAKETEISEEAPESKDIDSDHVVKAESLLNGDSIKESKDEKSSIDDKFGADVDEEVSHEKDSSKYIDTEGDKKTEETKETVATPKPKADSDSKRDITAKDDTEKPIEKTTEKDKLSLKEAQVEEAKSGSQTESPETSSEQALQTFKENDILDKTELGRKSPKEREQDVAKIVASVAEVLKSDAPLEEFEGKIPLNITPFVPFTATYTTELRETHITTVDSPVTESQKSITESKSEIRNVVETTVTEKEPEICKTESKVSDLLRDSKELMEATSKMISDIKLSKSEESKSDLETGTVQRMLVTASSEDGGEEIEICPKGTITFPRSSESSGRSSPDTAAQKYRHGDDSKKSSGKSTPDIKIVSEQEKADIESTEKEPLSGKSSGKSTPKSGKESPDIREQSPTSDSGIIEVTKADIKSGKSTPEPKDAPTKSTLDTKESLSGITSGKGAGDSGRSTPDIGVKADTLKEPETKTAFDSGRSSPDSKCMDEINRDEKLEEKGTTLDTRVPILSTHEDDKIKASKPVKENLESTTSASESTCVKTAKTIEQEILETQKPKDVSEKLSDLIDESEKSKVDQAESIPSEKIAADLEDTHKAKIPTPIEVIDKDVILDEHKEGKETEVAIESIVKDKPKQIDLELKDDEDMRLDEIPPAYEDLEQSKSDVDQTKVVKTDTKTSQKEVYTLKDEEDNIVKKEVDLKTSLFEDDLGKIEQAVAEVKVQKDTTDSLTKEIEEIKSVAEATHVEGEMLEKTSLGEMSKSKESLLDDKLVKDVEAKVIDEDKQKTKLDDKEDIKEGIYTEDKKEEIKEGIYTEDKKEEIKKGDYMKIEELKDSKAEKKSEQLEEMKDISEFETKQEQSEIVHSQETDVPKKPKDIISEAKLDDKKMIDSKEDKPEKLHDEVVAPALMDKEKVDDEAKIDSESTLQKSEEIAKDVVRKLESQENILDAKLQKEQIHSVTVQEKTDPSLEKLDEKKQDEKDIVEIEVKLEESSKKDVKPREEDIEKKFPGKSSEADKKLDEEATSKAIDDINRTTMLSESDKDVCKLDVKMETSDFKLKSDELVQDVKVFDTHTDIIEAVEEKGTKVSEEEIDLKSELSKEETLPKSLQDQEIIEKVPDSSIKVAGKVDELDLPSKTKPESKIDSQKDDLQLESKEVSAKELVKDQIEEDKPDSKTDIKQGEADIDKIKDAQDLLLEEKKTSGTDATVSQEHKQDELEAKDSDKISKEKTQSLEKIISEDEKQVETKIKDVLETKISDTLQAETTVSEVHTQSELEDEISKAEIQSLDKDISEDNKQLGTKIPDVFEARKTEILETDTVVCQVKEDKLKATEIDEGIKIETQSIRKDISEIDTSIERKINDVLETEKTKVETLGTDSVLSDVHKEDKLIAKDTDESTMAEIQPMEKDISGDDKAIDTKIKDEETKKPETLETDTPLSEIHKKDELEAKDTEKSTKVEIQSIEKHIPGDDKAIGTKIKDEETKKPETLETDTILSEIHKEDELEAKDTDKSKTAEIQSIEKDIPGDDKAIGTKIKDEETKKPETLETDTVLSEIHKEDKIEAKDTDSSTKVEIQSKDKDMSEDKAITTTIETELIKKEDMSEIDKPIDTKEKKDVLETKKLDTLETDAALSEVHKEEKLEAKDTSKSTKVEIQSIEKDISEEDKVIDTTIKDILEADTSVSQVQKQDGLEKKDVDKSLKAEFQLLEKDISDDGKPIDMKIEDGTKTVVSQDYKQDELEAKDVAKSAKVEIQLSDKDVCQDDQKIETTIKEVLDTKPVDAAKDIGKDAKVTPLEKEDHGDDKDSKSKPSFEEGEIKKTDYTEESSKVDICVLQETIDSNKELVPESRDVKGVDGSPKGVEGTSLTTTEIDGDTSSTLKESSGKGEIKDIDVKAEISFEKEEASTKVETKSESLVQTIDMGTTKEPISESEEGKDVSTKTESTQDDTSKSRVPLDKEEVKDSSISESVLIKEEHSSPLKREEIEKDVDSKIPQSKHTCEEEMLKRISTDEKKSCIESAAGESKTSTKSDEVKELLLDTKESIKQFPKDDDEKHEKAKDSRLSSEDTSTKQEDSQNIKGYEASKQSSESEKLISETKDIKSSLESSTKQEVSLDTKKDEISKQFAESEKLIPEIKDIKSSPESKERESKDLETICEIPKKHLEVSETKTHEPSKSADDTISDIICDSKQSIQRESPKKELGEGESEQSGEMEIKKGETIKKETDKTSDTTSIEKEMKSSPIKCDQESSKETMETEEEKPSISEIAEVCEISESEKPTQPSSGSKDKDFADKISEKSAEVSDSPISSVELKDTTKDSGRTAEILPSKEAHVDKLQKDTSISSYSSKESTDLKIDDKIKDSKECAETETGSKIEEVKEVKEATVPHVPRDSLENIKSEKEESKILVQSKEDEKSAYDSLKDSTTTIETEKDSFKTGDESKPLDVSQSDVLEDKKKSEIYVGEEQYSVTAKSLPDDIEIASKVDKAELSLLKDSVKVDESVGRSIESLVSDTIMKDDKLDSSKTSVIVDDKKTEDDKIDGLEKSEQKTLIKTETSVIEKTVKDSVTSKDLDVEKDIVEKSIKDAVKVFIEAEKDTSVIEEAEKGNLSSIASSSKDLSKPEETGFSGKSTPDIADVERDKQLQETLRYEKHIPGCSTPPTVPVSPIVKDMQTDIKSDICTEKKLEVSTISTTREQDVRSCTPGSDDYEHGVSSTHSDISSSQMSKAPNMLEGEEAKESDEDDILGSPTSVTSQIGHSPSSQYDFDDEKRLSKTDQMSASFYGSLPGEMEDSGFRSGRFLDESDLDFEKAMQEHRQTRGEDLSGEPSSYLYEITTAKYGSSSKQDVEKKTDIMTSSFIGTELPEKSTIEKEKEKDPIGAWGKPLGLPSPAPPDNKGTPKKERKLPANVTAKNKLNDDKKRSESPSKYDKKQRKIGGPIYVDLTYVPHHGNSNYSYVDFFKRIRARYYVFSGIEPSKEVYNALLEAKQSWEDKELEVTIIPTYDTDVLGYWVAENEELLTKYKIDLSPSASRCTINLQDHETSCSAYRLEF